MLEPGELRGLKHPLCHLQVWAEFISATMDSAVVLESKHTQHRSSFYLTNAHRVLPYKILK